MRKLQGCPFSGKHVPCSEIRPEGRRPVAGGAQSPQTQQPLPLRFPCPGTLPSCAPAHTTLAGGRRGARAC